MKRRTILLIILIFIFYSYAYSQQGWIRINQLGYTPQSIKEAVFCCNEKMNFDSFELIDILTEETVYRGSHIKSYGTYANFDQTYRLDFTEYEERGTYKLKIQQIESPPFPISDDIYDGTADFLLKYMRQQRCGYNPFLKDSCHTDDGFIVDHPTLDSVHIDVTGGWHDASDYLQYVATSANATHQMLFAYWCNPKAFSDGYQANGDAGGNGIPDILDEAKWGLDWLNKMNPEDGIMFNQIADDRDHRKFTLPTLDTISYGKGRERPVYFVTGKPQGLASYKNRTTGVSSTAAKYASAFALGSSLLRSYYPDFCDIIFQKAINAYRFAESDLGVCQTACNVSPYFYEEDNYIDDMELAAIHLFRVSRDSSYLDKSIYWGNLEPVTPWMGADTARHYQWYPFVNLGHFFIAKSTDGKFHSTFIRFMKRGIERVYKRGSGNAFQMGVPFIWCSNNLVAAMLTQLHLYEKLTHDKTYARMEASLRDWLFGCNPWGTSMIVGLPRHGDTPVDPHSAFTAAFQYPIDGGLVDGPVYTSIFKRLKGLKLAEEDEYAEFQSDLCVYHDDYGDYSTNEPTMDGTASLTYYLSSLEQVDNRSDRFLRNHGGIIRGDTTRKVIYLFFSGGDYNDGGMTIREILKKHSIDGHFFFTGDFFRNKSNTNFIRALIADGHYVGPHSDKHLLYTPWDNRDSLLVSKGEFIADLSRNYLEMAKFGIAKNDATLFLPPYEWYNEEISKWTKELGLDLVNFTAGTSSNADYTTPDMPNYMSSENILNKILSVEQKSPSGLNGFLLLSHVGSHPDRKDKFHYKLDTLIETLKGRGYRFELLRKN